jgi:hypothetical protein
VVTRAPTPAEDAEGWRNQAFQWARQARLWEQVARNIAQTVPDGADIFERQRLAHGAEPFHEL